jgi:butyryl-CoA dehydrogenase
VDFQLTEEQEMARQLASEFADKEVKPTAAERDEKAEFDRGIFAKMGELGFTGIPFPETWGGLDGGYLTLAICIEEIAKRCAATGGCLQTHVNLGTTPIYLYGTEEQKEKYARPLIAGEYLGAFALTEPGAGSDAGSAATVAVKDGDSYILNGSKQFITHGGEADVYIVIAMTDKSQGVRGLTAFIVEKDTPGLEYGKKENLMGLRSSPTREIIFNDCQIPASNLLGAEGQGFRIAMHGLDFGRVGVAAQSLGIAQAALDNALQYSSEREQFGKPINKFQAVAFKMADMAMQVEAARMLTWKAAWLCDQGQRFSKEAAMAKCFASDIAMQVATEAVQIFGGYGFTKEYPVERFMRDAKVQQIYEGTNEVQRMVISGALIAGLKK